MNFKPDALLAFIDWTSLNDHETEASMALFAERVQTSGKKVAALCVYPRFVKQLKHFFKESCPPIATVLNFPDGNQPLSHVLSELKQALDDGAAELDLVMPYQSFLQGEVEAVKHYIKSCRQASGNTTLKIILETGALITPEKITSATQAMAECGANFIKTSTGKIPQGATLEAAERILKTLNTHSRPIGLKVSGGIKEIDQALAYLSLAQKHQSHPPTPQTFRIGASQLVDKL